uniref:Uncharacterized protein n=1 Tax=Fagus sylvatica TaxID=28930 RepID=A0A2N9EMN6_FAGSY
MLMWLAARLRLMWHHLMRPCQCRFYGIYCTICLVNLENFVQLSPWEDTMDCKQLWLGSHGYGNNENHERRIETWEGHEAIVLGVLHQVKKVPQARCAAIENCEEAVVHDVKVKDDGYGELASPDWGEPRVIDELHPSRLGLGDVGCGGGRSCQDLRLSAR